MADVIRSALLGADLLADLERFLYRCSDAIAAVAHVVATFSGREEAERRRHERVDVVETPGPRRSHERFQFRERLFDRIEIRAVGRKKSDQGSLLFDRGSDLGLFVHGQVIEHDDVTGPQGRHEDLFDIGEKTRIIDRPIEDRRRAQALEPQGGDHRVRLPVTAGRVIPESLATRTAAVPAQQVGGHPAFVEEHVLARIAERQPRMPPVARGDDIRPALFVGVYGFF